MADLDLPDLVRDWDAQIEAANGDDVAASIGILRCSQRSHQAWLDWITEGGEDDDARRDGLMESEFHRRCIDQYEHIIGVIERLRGRSVAGPRKVHHRSPFSDGRYPACQVRPGLHLSDDPSEVTCRSCIRQRESGQLAVDRATAERLRAEKEKRSD